MDHGAEVDLKLESGRMVISRPRSKPFPLRSLLANSRRGNRHSETDWSGARGGEIW